jgi:hypothetical protein
MVEISQFFTRCSLPKNMCKTCANLLVLDLRFLWYRRRSQRWPLLETVFLPFVEKVQRKRFFLTKGVIFKA